MQPRLWYSFLRTAPLGLSAAACRGSHFWRFGSVYYRLWYYTGLFAIKYYLWVDGDPSSASAGVLVSLSIPQALSAALCRGTHFLGFSYEHYSPVEWSFLFA